MNTRTIAGQRFHADRHPLLALMTSIVIVGSGFTGFTCARRLARILGRRRAPVSITIISPVDYMLYTPAKAVTRAYHLYAIPRAVNRWAVSLAYLTDALFDRSVVSIGLASEEDAQFAASEGIPMPKTS